VIPFRKVHGIGNDFVLFDGIASDLSNIDFGVCASQLCDRRTGIGADGVLILERGSTAPFQMRIYNADGTEAEMCGNGIRCIGQYAVEKGYSSSTNMLCQTLAGNREIQVLESGLIQVDMGVAAIVPIFGNEISTTIEVDGETYCGIAVCTGNPNFVIYVPDVSRIDLANIGPKIETHPTFPNGMNVHFCQVLSRTSIV